MRGRVVTPDRPAGLSPIQLLVARVRARSRRQAAATATLLDRIVDRELALMRAMPVHLRARQVDKMAALVMLAQAHRHHARGWIGRRELRRRSRTTFDLLSTYLSAA
jgi:hypothetical protein